MKHGELSKLLNLPDSTLRKYGQDFAEYLSPAGVGGAGRHRDYTEQDARIMKLILDMKAQRLDAQSIDATLSSLRDGNWERLPALDQPAQSIIPTPDNMIVLQNEKSAMQREVAIWRELYETATSDRDELLRRLHEAETLLRLYEQGKLRPAE